MKMHPCEDENIPLTTTTEINYLIFSYLSKKDLQRIRESNSILKSQVDNLPVSFFYSRKKYYGTISDYIHSYKIHNYSQLKIEYNEVLNQIDAKSPSNNLAYLIAGLIIGSCLGLAGGTTYVCLSPPSWSTFFSCLGMTFGSEIMCGGLAFTAKVIKDKPCTQNKELEEKRVLLENKFIDAPKQMVMRK